MLVEEMIIKKGNVNLFILVLKMKKKNYLFIDLVLQGVQNMVAVEEEIEMITGNIVNPLTLLTYFLIYLYILYYNL